MQDLNNTIENPFWFTTDEFTTRFAHESARKGSKFFDGNNGDEWIVVSINREAKIISVKNITQQLSTITLAWA